ncbi:MAG: sensor histidine kinase [Actinomycetota bacterium]
MDFVGRSRGWIKARSPFHRDLLLAGALAAGSLVENLGAETWLLVLAPVAPLPLALRRRAPLLMAALLFTIHVAGEVAAPVDAAEGGFLFAVAALLIGMYSTAAYESMLARAVAGGLLIGVGANWDLVVGGLSADDFWPFRFFFMAGAWVAGRVLHGRGREVDQLEQQQEARTNAAIAEERARLARELHDVIAHNVSVMVVQAGAAQEVLARAPQRAVESLENIQRTGRETVTELRRLLGILRVGDEESLTTPQPGLGEVDALVQRVRGTGLPVELEISGRRRELPVSIDLSAYRIVQEGLTNALKHAAASAVHVQVTYGERDLTIEIVDDGRGASSNGMEAHGLIGMRERVAMFKGKVEFGNAPEGGFRVHARIPLDDGA